jgi:hypothetical protein
MPRSKRSTQRRAPDRSAPRPFHVGGLTLDYVGENITEDLLLPGHVAAALSGRSGEPLLPPEPKQRFTPPARSAILEASEYQPGQAVQLGQRGYRLVVFQYRFDGSPAGHQHSAGSYVGGLPQEFRAADGQYQTFTTGPGCGLVVETVTVFTYDGKVGTGQGSAPIRVPGLSPLGPSPNYVLIGSTGKHPDNHYGTADVNQRLVALANEYRARTGDRLYLNDMSLAYGGQFDIAGTWTAPHAEHRNGRSADIAATSETLKHEAVFLEILRKHTTNYILEGTGTARHYHVRL